MVDAISSKPQDTSQLVYHSSPADLSRLSSSARMAASTTAASPPPRTPTSPPPVSAPPAAAERSITSSKPPQPPPSSSLESERLQQQKSTAASSPLSSTVSSTTRPSPAESRTQQGAGPKPGSSAPPPVSADDDDEDDGIIREVVDLNQFGQILELDEDDDDSDFSRGMVADYLEQACKTFEQMESEIKDRNLLALAELGHFLKGSSAALGVLRVQTSCEMIQHWGKPQEPHKPLPADVALRKISRRLTRAKQEFREAEQWFKNHYDE